VPATVPSPQQIAALLERRVIGQRAAIQEISVALAKKLARLRVGNILMIGSSGSGKTTLMRAVEAVLAQNPALALRSTVVRIHANILGEEAEQGHPGEALLRRLLERARQQLGPAAPAEKLLEQASHGLVFVDEVDKIRSHVGGQVNISGIRAQEALLTLMENEAVPFTLPEAAGGGSVTVDSSGVLFVCAGAFEGLYDAVFHRVTAGRDKGALKSVTVVEDGRVREELPFVLRDWLKHEDLFEYGISPQFLSRFDALVLLDNLGEAELLRIFVESPESGLKQTQAYFAALGFRFELTEAAAKRIAKEASRQPRLGARALKEILRRVVGPWEFDPRSVAQGSQTLRLDVADVEKALAAWKGQQASAEAVTGWDQSFPLPQMPRD
jgi:ATP-dependent Clp protease ATP-binding subunit ClpX